MNAAIDRRYSKTPDNQRMPVAIEAAKTLVEELHSGCDDTDVVIGVVPWDKTVRLPSPEQWESQGWVDMSAYRAAATVSGYEDWEGCAADRRHAAADPRVSDGLSLTLPGSAPIPAFMYPDTNRLDPSLIAEVRQTIFDNFSAHGVEEGLGATGVDQLLRERGDNPWDRAGRGPNYHCTWTAILPLSSDREEVDRVLDSLYDTSRNPVLMGGVTMSHLGLAWGRRMLVPSWRTVWGDDAHPVEPAETVTKALVLLTDGQNGAHSDGWGELPGRLSARYDTVADEIVFGCDSRRVAGCGILRGEHAYRNDYSSRYTAIGRFGEGRPEDGFPVAGQDFGRASTGTQARERLRDLLRHSCELAHEEGLVVYTVSLLSPSQSISQGWKAQLVACSGNSETTTDAEREEYYLQGTDSASLEAAFREIGERLITVRRTS